VSDLGFIPQIRRYCKDCAHFRGELSAQDRVLLAKMLERYSQKTIVNTWPRKEKVKILSGKRVDLDKTKAAEILKRRAFCRRERVSVSPVDAVCYAWKPRE